MMRTLIGVVGSSNASEAVMTAAYEVGKEVMTERNKQDKQKSLYKRHPIQHSFWVYIGGVYLFFLGLMMLLFTAGWLSIKHHFPVFFIGIGLFGLIVVAIYREMFEKPVPDPKLEEVIATREQIIDTIIKRAKRYAILVGVIAVVGVAGYIQVTFGPQLNKIEEAEKHLKEIQEQKTKIDSLRQDMDRLRQEAGNLQGSLTAQHHYITRRIQIFDSSFAALAVLLPQARSAVNELKEISEHGKIIDRDFSEFRDNQHYEVTIHYSNRSANNIDSVHFILGERGFQVYLDEIKESEMGAFADFKGKLFYYSSEDESKAGSIERLLEGLGISTKPQKISDSQKAKKYDVWP